MSRERNVFLALYGHNDHVNALINNERVSHIIASRDDLTDEQVDTLVRSKDAYTQKEIASSKKLKPEHFDILANHEDGDVRAAVADNPLIPEHHLDKLATDPAHHVKFYANWHRKHRNGV